MFLLCARIRCTVATSSLIDLGVEHEWTIGVPGAVWALSEKPEPACEGASLRHSRGQLTPLGQRGGPVFFKDAATIEVTILIEVIVDRGVN